MYKLSHDQVANHFYNMGVQVALGNSGMDKTAGLGRIAARTGGGILGAAALSAPGMKAGFGLGAMKGSLPFLETIEKSGLTTHEFLKSNPEIMKQVMESAEGGAGLGLLTGLGIGGVGGQHIAKRLIR